MSTWLEIVDTAVKIGLGALISGVTTYWVTNTKSQHELYKNTIEDKRSTLREVAVLVEESSDLINDFVHVSRQTKEDLKNKSCFLMDAHKKNERAETLANLIGFKKLADAICNRGSSVREMHDLIAGSEECFDYELTNQYLDSIRESRIVIRDYTSNAYDEIGKYKP